MQAAPAPAPGGASSVPGPAPGPAPAPGPVPSPMASPAGSPSEPQLHPVHKAQWEHHEKTMASADYLLAKSKTGITESKIEHAKAEVNLAHHEGDQTGIMTASAKVVTLENKLKQQTQAVQSAKAIAKQEIREFHEAKAKAKAFQGPLPGADKDKKKVKDTKQKGEEDYDFWGGWGGIFGSS